MHGGIRAIGGAYFLVLLLFVCYVEAKKEEKTMNEQKHKVIILKRISKEAVSAESLRLLCQNLMVEALKYQQHR